MRKNRSQNNLIPENFVKAVKMALINDDFSKVREEWERDLRKLRQEIAQERKETEQIKQEIAEIKRKLVKYEKFPKSQ